MFLDKQSWALSEWQIDGNFGDFTDNTVFNWKAPNTKTIYH